jgi:uncharacterized membrane protein
MSEEKTANTYNKFVFVLVGVLMLLAGLTLVLVWWPDVVSIFKGVFGTVLAIAGLAVLYFQGKK